MSQPHWKLYKSMGDIGNIYKDTTGVYPPEAEIWQEYESDGKPRFQVYRFSLEQKSLRKGKIIPHGFHKRTDLPHSIEGYEEWYSKDLDSVARSAGTTKAKLAHDLCSANIVKRFNAYYDIGSYHGFENLDSYPLDLSEMELNKRQKPSARKLHNQRYGHSTPGTRRRRSY